MERFTQAIKKSVESENWYSALTLALTIPDICGRLSYPDLKKKSEKRYIKWFNKYMLHHYESEFHGEGFTFLSGADCYALRCALLHEGRDDITSQSARTKVLSKIIFAVNASHKLMFNDVVTLRLQTFCSEICQGVESWNEDYKHSADVQDAIKELLTIHTQGFSPAPGVSVDYPQAQEYERPRSNLFMPPDLVIPPPPNSTK